MIETGLPPARDTGPNVRARIDPELKALAVARLAEQKRSLTDVIEAAIANVVADAPGYHRRAARERIDEAVQILATETASADLTRAQADAFRDLLGHLADARLALAELIGHG